MAIWTMPTPNLGKLRSKGAIKSIKKNTLLRVIPIMAFQTIFSDIYMLTYFLTCYLTFYLTSILTFYLPFFLAFYLASNYSGILSGMYSGIYSGILFDIYSGILSDIYSDILSGILSDILCGGGSGQEGDEREVEGRSEIPALVRALSYKSHCKTHSIVLSEGKSCVRQMPSSPFISFPWRRLLAHI